MNKSNTRVIFFGTPSFAVTVLETLVRDGYNILAVVTEPDKEFGRKKALASSPIKIAAEKHGIPVLQPAKLKNNEAIVRELSSIGADVGVIAAYGKIIPKEIIDFLEYGILCIHPSILPNYRGPSPVQTAILNGDKKMGVTIMKVDEELDHGSTLGLRQYEL